MPVLWHVLFLDCGRNETSCYFSVPARRWWEARNNCTAKDADLAVLTPSIYDKVRSRFTANATVGYYIGLRNVRLQWNGRNESGKDI